MFSNPFRVLLRTALRFFSASGLLNGDRVRRTEDLCSRLCRYGDVGYSEYRDEIGIVEPNPDFPHALVNVRWIGSGKVDVINPENLELVEP